MRMRKQIKLDNRIRHCYSCGERKKIVVIVATLQNKILHNYCEECFIIFEDQFKGAFEKHGLKLVMNNKFNSQFYSNKSHIKESQNGSQRII